MIDKFMVANNKYVSDLNYSLYNCKLKLTKLNLNCLKNPISLLKETTAEPICNSVANKTIFNSINDTILTFENNRPVSVLVNTCQVTTWIQWCSVILILVSMLL